MSNIWRNANLISMTKHLVDNDKTVSTKIVATRIEQNIGATKVSDEKVWKNFGYFNNQKSDYNMKTINYPENTIYYVNQSYLTV